MFRVDMRPLFRGLLLAWTDVLQTSHPHFIPFSPNFSIRCFTVSEKHLSQGNTGLMKLLLF